MGLWSSKSSSTNLTENIDGSIIGGNDSMNVSAAGSENVTVTLTDRGAVADSMALAKRGIELAQTNAGALVTSSTSLLEGALGMVGKQQQDFTSALENIKTSDVRVLIIAGLAVLGVVAVIAFKKG